MKKKIFRSSLRFGAPRNDGYILRELAKADPENFMRKVESLVESGKIGIDKISDWRALYQNLADVQIPVTIDMAGAQRAVMASAFPVLTGTTVVKAINDAYNAVPTIGDMLVEEIEDNKKVTTIANVHALDKNIDEVKEGDDFPEISADEEKMEIRHKRNGRRLSISAEAIEENEVADIVSRVNALGAIAADWVEEQTLYRVTDHHG